MVEEAGQVLEAHILTNLVPSGMPFHPFFLPTKNHYSHTILVHHVICIGDPQQLRPNIASFGTWSITCLYDAC